MKKSTALFILLLTLGILWFFAHRNNPSIANHSLENLDQRNPASSPMNRRDRGHSKTLSAQEINSNSTENLQAQQKQLSNENPDTVKKNLNPDGEFPGYETVDGLAVIEGDIVLGVTEAGKTYSGPNPTQSLQLWPEAIIPYVIQEDLPNPQRVIQAMALMTTGVTFLPYSGQSDVLVFEPGSGNCRSYLGRVGGKQPLWIGPGCGAKEIAHEIMHALGFIHEQNRTDRDSFIEVLHQNIQKTAEINFSLFPSELMKASGLGPFDYESIMLYPRTMFSIDGVSETMQSRVEGKHILPGNKLSLGDVLRLEQLHSLK